ncbi:MAG: M48 family metalloprotease [Fibromonadaceae bacterium]|jgi:Zn-dependent protease with chaperone function|nr:M48 family metalloprotease [Fibromonadaceae bacterium]
MLSHEFFHEQAHIEKRHELQRFIFLMALNIISFFIYRFFCRWQEYDADKTAARKCGKKNAIERLKLLQIQEGKAGFFANLFSLHPKTEKRIGKIKRL